MRQHPPGSLEQFDNRMRILLNLDLDVFPAELRKDNPTSAALWLEGGANRLLAFIRAPDPVRAAIWRALLDYEGGKKSARNPRWPLAPACECGAIPGHDWPMCQAAAAQGREAGAGADAEDCERWQRVATECGWLAPQEVDDG